MSTFHIFEYWGNPVAAAPSTYQRATYYRPHTIGHIQDLSPLCFSSHGVYIKMFKLFLFISTETKDLTTTSSSQPMTSPAAPCSGTKDRETFLEIRTVACDLNHPLVTAAARRTASEWAAWRPAGSFPFPILGVVLFFLSGSGTRSSPEFPSASARPRILRARRLRGIASAGTFSPARQAAVAWTVSEVSGWACASEASLSWWDQLVGRLNL